MSAGHTVGADSIVGSAASGSPWAEALLGRLEQAGLPAAMGPTGLERLTRLVEASQAAGNWVCQDPQLGAELGADDFGVERTRSEYLRRLGLPDGPQEAQPVFFRRLRLGARREILRILAREATGQAPVEVTARELSALAEACVEAALSWAWGHLAARHGVPKDGAGVPIGLCALGMGKLGGGELNLSSDVDLVFVYRTARGGAPGGEAGPLDARSFCSQAVRLTAEALGRVTAEGLVFRVDLDLRPEGRSGELAQPLDNAVLYYQSWGQTWERAALLKARPVAGDLELGRRFLEEVAPFVFSRSLDYTTVEDLAEMRRRIDAGAARRGAGGVDLKLGRGGIREVEFFVQTLQLVHGGRLPEVRERNTLAALLELARAGVVEYSVAEGLSRCYRFLRTAEHAVQALHLRRTHSLPTAPEELAVVARRMGFAGEGAAAALTAALEQVRAEVHGHYGRLSQGAARQWEEEPGEEQARELLALEAADPKAEEALARAGFRNPRRAREGLKLLQRGPPRSPPSPRARRLLGRVAPHLLNAARRCPDPDRALLHLGEFLSTSGARASYLALLEENPATARLLVTLFGTSGFLSRYLLAHPELLDELVLGTHGAPLKDGERLHRELDAACAAAGDEEERLDALRRFRNAQFLRIALHDLWGGLGPEEVGQQLTRVAEACLERAYRDSLERLLQKYGREGGMPRFAVLGLGKLGGAELDYYSDLDVAFAYDGGQGPEGGGLTGAELAARLAQRVIGSLSARTREGVAFQVDARLRPSGQAGPLVTSLGAFDAYHRGGRGRTWERQALTRLRPVAGDPELGQAARRAVEELLYAAPPRLDPRPEIREMRRRIEAERGRESLGRVDLKAGPGGLLDAEFAVQALQLLHGWEHPAVRSPNTLEALEALAKEGLLADEERDALLEGYRFLRRVEARVRILRERPTDCLPADPVRRAGLARGLGYGEEGEAALMADVAEHRRRVRAAYASILGGEAT